MIEPCPGDPVDELPQTSSAAAWALVALLVAVVVVDVLLWYSGRPTMSQWVKHKTAGRPWWKLGAAVLIGGTLWHLLLGGPL